MTTYFWKIELTAGIYDDEDAYLVYVSESRPSGNRTWKYAIPAIDSALPELLKDVVRRHPAFANALQDALMDYLSQKDMRHISGDFFVGDER